jgi:hypothetical protein
MKRFFTTLIVLLFALHLLAQHCTQVSNSIPLRNYSNAGLYPPSESLPCIVPSTAVSDTIYFHNYSTVVLGGVSVTINSLTIDSINNLPAGLCWNTNSSTNTFASGADGVILVQGTTTAAPGQYKLKLKVSVSTSFGPFNNQDPEPLLGLRYYLRVRSGSRCCFELDTVNGKTNYFIPESQLTVCTGGCTPVVVTSSQSICKGGTYRYKGRLLTQAGSYSDTIQRGGGCDSINTLVLTVNPALTATIRDSVCAGGVYLWHSKPLTSAGTYTDTASTAAGCDSITTLLLSVNPVKRSNLSKTICKGDFYRYRGRILSAAGSYTDTVQTAKGCDSIITLQLAVATVSPVIFRTGDTLLVDSFTTMQWYRNGSIISNATGYSYVVTRSGSYTVLVADSNGCKDSAAAIQVVKAGIEDKTMNGSLTISPNPNSGNLVLNTTTLYHTYVIYDRLGRDVHHGAINSMKQPISVVDLADGVYLIKILSSDDIATQKFTISR